MILLEEHIGEKHGRITIIGIDTSRRQRRVVGKCDCGNIKAFSYSQLRMGRARSCGCLNREMCIERSTRHGHAKKGSNSPTYRIWAGMIQRCSWPGSSNFHLYGGRGIKVSERWHTYENFLFDMGERPSKNHSIDRYPNKDGNYEPGNCRWATQKEQARNIRTNVFLSYNGVTKLALEWAEELRVPVTLIYGRRQKGWSDEKTLTYRIAKSA